MSKVIIKTPAQIAKIRTSGEYLTELLQMLYQSIAPGMSLIALQDIAMRYIDQHHLIPAFYQYGWFPGKICLSVNDCVVHGIPDRTILKAWDLLKVDAGINYQWAISDAAFSIVVWWAETNPEAQWLIDATKAALDTGLAYIQSGKELIHRATHIEKYMNDRNYSVIRSLTGHGVGVDVHEAPHIYNHPHKTMRKHRFQKGMVVALEPITALASVGYIEDMVNNRNLYTDQWDLGAQREYTVVVTDNGPEVLAGIQKL